MAENSGYMTIAVPKDENFNYDALHAIARARGMNLGAFVRKLIEDQCAAEITAHSLFAKSVAHMHQTIPEGNTDHA